MAEGHKMQWVPKCVGHEINIFMGCQGADAVLKLVTENSISAEPRPATLPYKATATTYLVKTELRPESDFLVSVLPSKNYYAIEIQISSNYKKTQTANCLLKQESYTIDCI